MVLHQDSMPQKHVYPPERPDSLLQIVLKLSNRVRVAEIRENLDLKIMGQWHDLSASS